MDNILFAPHGTPLILEGCWRKIRTHCASHNGFNLLAMVIFLQYSFTDLRAFVLNEKSQLRKPRWPNPNPFEEYVRGTGQIIPRSKFGLPDWIGEDRICKITRSISFSNSGSQKFSFKNVGKHFFSGYQRVLSKYEFVFISSGQVIINNDKDLNSFCTLSFSRFISISQSQIVREI